MGRPRWLLCLAAGGAGRGGSGGRGLGQLREDGVAAVPDLPMQRLEVVVKTAQSHSGVVPLQLGALKQSGSAQSIKASLSLSTLSVQFCS